MNLGQAFWRNFLGSSPPIYKGVVLAFLILNPLALIRFGYTVSAGLILMEFIVLLLMRLACHPLQAGGLIALQAVIMGLTTPAAITEDLLRIYPVFILIIFMLSGILFARELLFVLFTRIFLRIAPRCPCKPRPHAGGGLDAHGIGSERLSALLTRSAHAQCRWRFTRWGLHTDWRTTESSDRQRCRMAFC
ncbi:MAG: hypothetical protein P8176_13685 [Gammaproteobacteria bacterium]